MISTIYKGYTMVIEGVPYIVVGSRSLRGTYYYILQNAATKTKSSVRRDVVLRAQETGQITIAP